jgi:hypothetical protein
LSGCEIKDHATVANVIRCGFSVAVDGDKLCYDMKIENNDIEVKQQLISNETPYTVFNIENKFPNGYENSRNIIKKNRLKNIGTIVPAMGYAGFLREQDNLTHGPFVWHFGSVPYQCVKYGAYTNPYRAVVGGKLQFEY